MKEYKIEITYIDKGGGQEMHTTVNGKDEPMPRRLRRWIAESYLLELITLDKFDLK